MNDLHNIGEHEDRWCVRQNNSPMEVQQRPTSMYWPKSVGSDQEA